MLLQEKKKIFKELLTEKEFQPSIFVVRGRNFEVELFLGFTIFDPYI